HSYIHPDVIQISFMMMSMWGFNHNPATHNLIIVFFQLGSFFTNIRFQRIGMGNITKCNL
ncbi:hypothetical protein QQ73_17845, partial [Candidatus Endoriftia persephone str. Guaymas]|nr:hypothetical protein [Candidatus Endoriftia persephone str. Guaymas]